MPVIALWLLLSSAPPAVHAALPPDRPWRVELPLAFTATTPASNVETAMSPWVGVRAGRWLEDVLPPVAGVDDVWLGVDGTGMVTSAKDGTNEVNATRTLLAAEGRALVGFPVVASTFSALVPYAFVGLGAGGGIVTLSAFGDERTRPLFTWATRAGAGAELRIHALTTRLELGAGMRDVRFELSSALSLGVAF